MSYNQNLTVNKGENKTLNFSPTSAQGVTDITGWTLVFSVRQFLSDSNYLFQITTTLSVNGQLTVTTASQGLFSVDLTADATNNPANGGAAIGSGRFSWDVWRVDAGFEAELGNGNLVVNPAARTGS